MMLSQPISGTSIESFANCDPPAVFPQLLLPSKKKVDELLTWTYALRHRKLHCYTT